MNRKIIYPKTKGYWVYAHITPDGMQYIGMSQQQPSQRWVPSDYKGTTLEPYIEQYGWENMSHTVLLDNLTKAQAEQWEDQIITELQMNGLCINKKRSGGHKRDNDEVYKEQRLEYQKIYNKAHRDEQKEYSKAYRKAHKEEILEQKKAYYQANREERLEYQKAYAKQRLSTIEGKIYSRVKGYNRYHPDLAIETPLEAKQKYLEFGYIPNYIKNYDLFESK